MGTKLPRVAYSQKYLGEVFDIHTGGIDLIPTHHENEIAQSKGYSGKIPANYWMHGEYLLINDGKMSKSLGNVYLLQDLVDRGYNPLVYKMFCYTTVYRKKLNFTWEAMDSAKIALERLKELRQQGKNKAIAIGSTGIGKTFFAVFDVLQFEPKRVLYLVHNENILKSAKASFERVIKTKKYGFFSFDISLLCRILL